MEPQRFITYPNRTAQYQDEFWYDIALPWLYDHWYVVLIAIAALWIFFKVANKRNRY